MEILLRNYSAGRDIDRIIVSHSMSDTRYVEFSSGFSQALTTMAALNKITSSERNRMSADVLDKHPDSFTQPQASKHQPRLVKRDGISLLRNNRAHYNPPPTRKTLSTGPNEESLKVSDQTISNTKSKVDDQSALRYDEDRFFVLSKIDAIFVM
jgi:hypothetical protein